MRARVVGDLPVALGIKEMMKQVHAFQLVGTGVYVKGAKEDPNLGPLSFHYAPNWNLDPEPNVVKNTGLSWEVEVRRNISHGPLQKKDYKYELATINGHWGSSEHSIEGKFFDGEIHLVHHHLKYDDVKVTFVFLLTLRNFVQLSGGKQACRGSCSGDSLPHHQRRAPQR